MKVKLYYLNELNPLAQVRALANTLICEKSVYCVELNAMRERLKGGYFDIHAAINGLNMEFIRLRNSRQNLARMEQDPANLRKLVIENHLMFNADGDYYHFHRKRWYRSGNIGKNAKIRPLAGPAAIYNGWKNYNQWNVVLWINNDESLYFFALGLVNECGNKDAAADLMCYRLKQDGITHTPDGVPYTKTNIRAAMIGMKH